MVYDKEIYNDEKKESTSSVSSVSEETKIQAVTKHAEPVEEVKPAGYSIRTEKDMPPRPVSKFARPKFGLHKSESSQSEEPYQNDDL